MALPTKTYENIDGIPFDNTPPPPKPPLTRILREGGTGFCNNCGSTMSKNGFLRLFGKMCCDNKECFNHN